MLRHTAMPQLRRMGAALQAALFGLGLLVSPVVHNRLCNDLCALKASASASHASCHEHGRGTAGNGCRCLGDCCTISALCVAPDAVSDAAPPSPLPLLAPSPGPERVPRAPDAWVLPYPTGPPSA